MVCLESFSHKSLNRADKIKAIILQIVSVVAISAIAELICCNYGVEGILYIVAFYICRKNWIYQVLMFLLAYMVATGNQPPMCTLLALPGGTPHFRSNADRAYNTLHFASKVVCQMGALLPLAPPTRKGDMLSLSGDCISPFLVFQPSGCIYRANVSGIVCDIFNYGKLCVPICLQLCR